MKWSIPILTPLLALLHLIMCGQSDQETDPAAQYRCPIMPMKKVERQFYFDHDGKRVYLCCQACIDICRKNRTKWINLLEGQGKILERIPPS